jgi:hypothetical protein
MKQMKEAAKYLLAYEILAAKAPLDQKEVG